MRTKETVEALEARILRLEEEVDRLKAELMKAPAGKAAEKTTTKRGK